MRKNVITAFGVISLIAGYFLFQQWPYWDLQDARLADSLVRAQARVVEPDPDFVLLEIDDYSLQKFSSEFGKWPWSRSVHAFMIDFLQQQKVKAIVFDIIFAEADIYRPDDDAFFAEQVSQYPNIYLASVMRSAEHYRQDETLLQSLPKELFLQRTENTEVNENLPLILPWVVPTAAWRTGLINFTADADGVGRYYQTWAGAEHWQIPYLPLKVIDNIYPDRSAPSQRIRLRYKGADEVPYQTMSFAEAWHLLSEAADREQAKFFQDKVVVVSVTATGLHDVRATPMHRLQPAAVILTTAMDNLKNQDFFVEIKSFYIQILALIFIITLVWQVKSSKSIARYAVIYFSVLCVVSAALWWLASMLASDHYLLPLARFYFPVWSIFILCLCYRGVMEYLTRKRATEVFSRFMDAKVVNTLIESKNWRELMGSKECQLTVLFSDIRNFTTLSESRAPQEVMAFLNQYLQKQVETIFKYNGTMDKFIGDAVMAFWGAPLPDAKQAENAINAAQEMMDNLYQLRTDLSNDLSELDIGIGIHTGTAVVGMLGSLQRFDYTAIGDTVNLASRIEGLTKQHGHVLVSQATRDACSEKYKFECVGSFDVKGRSEKVNLYKPLRGEGDE